MAEREVHGLPKLDEQQAVIQSIIETVHSLFEQLERSDPSSICLYIQTLEPHLILLRGKIKGFRQMAREYYDNSIIQKDNLNFCEAQFERYEAQRRDLEVLFETKRRRAMGPSAIHPSGLSPKQLDEEIRKVRRNLKQTQDTIAVVDDIADLFLQLNPLIAQGMAVETETRGMIEEINVHLTTSGKLMKNATIRNFMKKFGLWAIAIVLILIDVCIIVIRMVRK